MKILFEISDATLGIGRGEQLGENYQIRKSARAVLERGDGTIALQHLKKYGFYKLPGGGVETGESLEQALMRELHEEVGCNINITKPVGVVIEYRDLYKLLQINYCFVATITSDITLPSFEAAEIAAGQSNLWLQPTDAIAALKTSDRSRYEAKFNVPRELAFLEEYMTGVR
jgi:ADP-ribose pyrophosphatase YjhB (NUDIX family)